MTQPVQFQFVCQSLPEDTFAVNSLEGEEAISQLYRFDIELRSLRVDVDPDTLLSQNCRLSLWIDGEERRIHGILSDCEMLKKVGEHVLYRAVLVPRMWQLGLYHSNEVFLDKTVPDIIHMVLEEGGFSRLDYELNLVRNYRRWPYRCQYEETHLDFLQRLMEREGIYYFFEQQEHGERLIITDHLQFHDTMPKPDVIYDPVSGLEGERFGNSIQNFLCRQKRIARRVTLRDYNDEKPSVDIKGQAQVDAAGTGDVNVFGLNIVSPEEGRELAEIRAEQIRSTRQVFHGESTVGRLAPGYSFCLSRHFRPTFNQNYLVTYISHSGRDPTLLALGSAVSGQPVAEAYKNTFSAIAASLQYRPDPIPQRPHVHGTLDAIIDAEGDGQYAEIDSEGRYKVILPFDRQLRDEGKASHWVRMSQAFAGEREGMHFPLRKGAHVLLSFIGGDPDRPVITGSMPNAGQPSVVTSENQTKSKIQTRAGNFIEMEDREESRRIKLYSPHENTYVHLGANNAPGNGIIQVTEGISRNEIGGGTQHTYVDKATLNSWKASSNAAVITGENDQLFNEQAIYAFKKKNADGTSNGNMSSADELTGNYHILRRKGDYYVWTDSNEFIYGGGNVYNFGNGYEETHISETGIEDKNETFEIPPTITGAINYSPGDNLISKTWGDTLEYQCGNVYGWGDTCEYSFGNGYAENHISGSGNHINKAGWDHDLCSPPTAGGGSRTISGSSLSFSTDDSVVEKTIGHQYGYTKGNTIEVTVGDSEEHSYGNSYSYQHGGRHEETVYIHYAGADVKILHTEQIDDSELEWKFHPRTGALSSFSASAECGHVTFETKMVPTFETSIDISAVSTSIEMGINAISINLNACQMSMELQPFKMEIELGSIEIKLPGFKYSTDAIENKAKLTELEQKMAGIKTILTDVNVTQAQIATGVVDLQAAVLKMFA